MALLTGMTADGLEVPVQVLPDGKLVAEGLAGPAGPSGASAVIGGTAALPGLHPPGDENTGFYSPNPNELSFSTDGAERLRIDAVGRVLLGSTTYRGDWFNQARVAEATMERSTGSCVFGLCYNFSNAGGPALLLGKTRGTTNGAKDIVQNGDNVGKISYQASNGINLIEVAQVRAIVDGTPSTSAVPTSLHLQTSNISNTANVSRLICKPYGVVNIPDSPVHADNPAARASGLVAGDIYRKSDGTMMIAF